MRFWAVLPALLTAGIALSGCQFGGGRSKGVFEPADIAPPPSVSGVQSPRNAAASKARPGGAGSRPERRLTVPGALH